MNNYPKFYIGPMSKNIVDAMIEYSNKNEVPIGMIPSRRQVEYDGGYVNNWNTQDFVNYVRYRQNNTSENNIILQRDHAGPGQGLKYDDGYESLRNDCEMNLIHIDPWKEHPNYIDGLKATIDMIQFCDSINPLLQYEVGTEESIRKFEVEELEHLIRDLKYALEPKLFAKVIYVVIQCGTSLKGTDQTGTYDRDRLMDMVRLCRKYHKMSKEHNGDYQTIESINEKFSLGLDAINIAPEFGVIETKVYLDKIADMKSFDECQILWQEFYQLCLESKKWEKWVSPDFDPSIPKNQMKLVEICGHYVFSYPMFQEKIKARLGNIDNDIKIAITKKLDELYGR